MGTTKPTEREIYASKHSCCPRCLHGEISSTCIGQVYGTDTTWEEMKDTNRSSCTKCDWVGIVHDLIPAANWDWDLAWNSFVELTRKMTEEWIGLPMTELQRKALASKPLLDVFVEDIYECAPRMTRQKAIEELRRVCASHERLRRELAGAEMLLNEDDAK
jgi:hypothetical protein